VTTHLTVDAASTNCYEETHAILS